MRTIWILLIAPLALSLPGCIFSQTNVAESPNMPLSSPTSETISTLISAQPTQGDTTQGPPSLPTPADDGLQNLITKATEDLAKRLSISVVDIHLVEAKVVVWRDASLGCPKPGIDYVHLETPGYSILLDAAGKTYNYHTDKIRRVILCNTK